MEIETPVLLAYAIEDSTDIFRISGGGDLNTPNPPPLGTPLDVTLRRERHISEYLNPGRCRCLVSYKEDTKDITNER